MYNLFIDDAVTLDVLEAVQTYRSYFLRCGEPEKGNEWADRFLEDYTSFLETLEMDPLSYPLFRIYPFNKKESHYRYCTLGWFLALFTVEDNEVCLWRVMSSRAGFSGLRTR